MSAQQGREYGVRSRGARADGRSMDTEAVQGAIDACAEAGGGVVRFAPGTYLCGTLNLKSNVKLRLEANACLLGTTRIEDYIRCAIAHFPQEFSHSLIYAEGAENVAIAGPGVIDGQGRSWPHGAENFNAEDMDRAETAESFSRPVMARFENCRNVSLEGVVLQNGASMAVHCEGCRDVRIRGVRVDNRANQNTDGLDLIGCENVFISECDLSCGDDAIPIFSSARNIVISNCVLSSRWAAIRLGPFSTGAFRDVSVSHCVIHHTYGGAIKLQLVEGGVMENISFDDLVMDHVTGPIAVRVAGWLGWRLEREKSLPHGTLKDVSFSNITARVADNAYPLEHEGPRNPGELRSCINITGLPEHPVQGLTFDNVRLTFPGGGTAEESERRDVPELPDAYPEYHMFGTLPAYGFYARHARDLTLRGVRFDLEAPDLRPAIHCEDVDGLELAGVSLRGSCEADCSVRLRDTRHVFVHGCRALGPAGEAGTFLRVEGRGSRGIRLTANSLAATERSFALAEETPPDAVSDG